MRTEAKGDLFRRCACQVVKHMCIQPEALTPMKSQICNFMLLTNQHGNRKTCEGNRNKYMRIQM